MAGDELRKPPHNERPQSKTQVLFQKSYGNDKLNKARYEPIASNVEMNNSSLLIKTPFYSIPL